MKTEHVVLGVVAILVVGLLIYTITSLIDGPPSQKNTLSTQSPSSEYQSITTGTTDPGSVSIELTPLGMKDGKFEVQIAANTHSVDLSQFDLKKITTFTYGAKTISPSDAPTLSGHHANGIIVFDLIEKPKTFTMNIKRIPAVEDRVFQW